MYLKAGFNLNELNWRILSSNPNAIELLNANQGKIDWKERDIFCIPSWAWHEHVNLSETEDACLFSFNDLPVIESLGLFQFLELEENNGFQKQ